MRLCLFLTILLTPALASAGNVILMVNMNYSSAELKALEEVAARRGQRVEVVPPRSLNPLGENLFNKRDSLQAELQKKFPGANPLEIKSAVAGMITQGAAWKPSSELASYVGTVRMNELFQAARDLKKAEQKEGTVLEQLRRKGAELKQKGDRVDSFVLSSHSDGSNPFGESGITLSITELAKLKQEHPQLFLNPRHVLLMGCYNLTKPNRQAWRYDLFPLASMLAGFGVKAPSRYDPKSANFIREVMDKADELDRKMLAKGGELDPAELERGLKTLESFTSKGHPGVADYCYTVVEGQPKTYVHDCNTQWKEIYEQKGAMEKYWDPVNPQEDPPSLGGGELRNFYNLLQAACPAIEAAAEKNDWQASERMRVALREEAIRLIYWWNVQRNFSVYLQTEIATMNRRLAASGVSAQLPKLDGTSSRVDFVGAYNAVVYELRTLNPGLLRDFDKLYGPLLHLKGESSVAKGESLSADQTLARNAIPFAWVESITVLGKR